MKYTIIISSFDRQIFFEDILSIEDAIKEGNLLLEENIALNNKQYGKIHSIDIIDGNGYFVASLRTLK